jgi:undecaprenyl pyrophosphate synthase
MQRLANLRRQHNISVSAIAEIAIESYLDDHPEDELETLLRSAGAVRRRG